MFLRSFRSIVSRHGGVQRASLCKSVSTVLSKPLEQGTRYKNINLVKKICAHSQITYSNIPSNNDKNVGQASKANTLTEETQILTRAQKLKKAVAEYGTTVIVFHVGISLISLGSCYLLVSSGLDLNQILVKLGLTELVKGNILLVSNAGTFAMAYAIHKVFAPVRMSITLASVPFLVRYLRQKGILKK